MQVAVRKRHDERRTMATVGYGDARIVGLAEQIREAHKVCIAYAHKSIGQAIDAGALLSRAKAMLRHGDFRRWLAKKLPEISDRTARLYMQIHANRDKITENGNAVAVLSLRQFAEKLRAESARPEQPIVRRLLRGRRARLNLRVFRAFAVTRSDEPRRREEREAERRLP